MAAKNFDPIASLIDMCQETYVPPGCVEEQHRLNPGLRAKIMLELIQYLMPKLKAVEMSGSVSHEHVINIVRYGEDGTIKREEKRKDEPREIPVQVVVNKVVEDIAGEDD